MESFTAFRLGLCALALFVAVPAQAQTELYDFADAPPVVVFRSTDPAPIVVPSVVQVPAPGVPTTVLMPPIEVVEPARVTVYSPVVPAVPAVTTVYQVYRPTITYQPVVVSQPVPAVVAPAAVAVPVGPRVTVRPKVYIQGQPLRNLFRAITP